MAGGAAEVRYLTARERRKVYLSPGELKLIQEAIGNRPLSAWAREVLLRDAQAALDGQLRLRQLLLPFER